MSDHRIAIVYFSATHVTKIYAEVIRDELIERGCGAQLIDVTPYASRQDLLPVDDFDGFIFGFPVFSDFAPSVINEWIPTLNGKGKRCTTFFTYGARTTGYAHFHTKLLLEEAGFQVQFSAEFLGRHSFNVAGWRILPNRPNESDFVVARAFAALAVERFSQDSDEVLALQKPFKYNEVIELGKQKEKSAERRWTHPFRFAKECSMCLRCEIECPNQAFDADTGLSDPLKCIECMHCVYVCPDKVLQVNERMKDVYSNFLENWHLTKDMMDKKRSRVITQAWQTAF
ncbi:MAG: 4Fe-4S ferredoxin [Chloroflexi bacterium]|nr:4Fe-4S ferredoxin [Chloroflexota bacterium]